jgi:hypothetical protein
MIKYYCHKTNISMLKYPTIFYTRVILLQIMRDWGVGRAIPE